MKKTLLISFFFFALLFSLSQFDFKIFSPSQGCAFCRSDVLQRQTIYRGDSSLALLTHKPALQGHTLIIPIRHVERFEDLTSQEIADLGTLIKKIDAASKKAYGNTGYLLLQKNGKEAGQSVPHVHFHYLPRHQGDSHLLFTLRFFISPWLKPLSEEETYSQIAALKNLE